MKIRLLCSNILIILLLTIVNNGQSAVIPQICSYDNLLGYSICSDAIGVPYISGTINTNSGRTLNLVDSAGIQTFSENDNGTVIACYQNNVLSQFCLDNLNSTTVKYGGSDAFCALYTCKASPVCLCKIGVAVETLTNSLYNSFTFDEDTNGLINTYISENSLILLDYLTLSMSAFVEQNFIMSSSSKKRDVISNYPVFVSFESPIFSFVFGDSNPKLITLFGETFSQTLETNNTFTSIVLNISESSVSQKVEITVQTLDIPSTVLFQTNFNMIGLKTCILPDCTFCYQALNAFDCSPSGYKAWIIVSWSIVIILLGGWLLVFYIWGASVAFWFILKPIKILWNMMPTMRKKRFYIKAKRFGSKFYDNWFTNESDTIDLDDLDNKISNKEQEKESLVKENKELKKDSLKIKNKKQQISKNVEDGKKLFFEYFGDDVTKKQAQEYLDDLDSYEIDTRDLKKIKMARVSILQSMLLMFIFFTCILACSSSQIISTQLTNCQASQNGVDCQMVYNSQITLRSIGDSICINFNTTDQGIVKYLNITYVKAVDEYFTGTGYLTADWIGKTQSNFRCFEAGHCTLTDCSNVNTENLRLALGELSSPYLSAWPGVTECTRACSNLLCGCLLNQPGCIFSGYSIVPYGSIYGYRPFSDRIINPIIEICTEDSCSRHELGDGTAHLNDMQITIDGTLDATNYIYPFTGKTGVLAGNVSRVVLAAGINTPIAGLVGDIQSPDTSTFQTGGQNAFIYDPELLVSEIPVNKAMQYTFRQSGISLLTSQNSILLPYNSPKGLYSLTSDGLSGNLNQGPALVLNLDSSTDIVSITTNVVCPTCEFVGIYGCFNCSFGAWIAFKSKSTCLGGPAELVSSLHLNQLIVTLETDYKIFNVSFYSSSSEIDSSIDVVGTSQKCTIPVKGTLHTDIPILTNQTNNNTNGTNTDSKDGWWQGKSWQWFIVVGLPIIAGVILLSLLVIALIVFIVFVKKIFPIIKNVAATYGVTTKTKTS